MARLAQDRTKASWFDLPTALITAVYSAAWFLMLFNGGRYWDDWVQFRVSPQATWLMARQLGQVWQPVYWLALSWMPGAEYLGHALTFALFLACALLLNRILRRAPGVDETAQTLIPMLFAVFPVNAARFALVDFQYTISLAAFYYAWYLIAVDLERPSVVRRIIAGVLFTFALVTTNSLLAFVFLVPLYVLWVRPGALRDAPTRRELLVRYGFLLVLPFLVFAFRSVALKPWGIYEGYNEVGSASLGWALLNLPAAVRESFGVQLLSALPWVLLAVPLYFAVRKLQLGAQESLRAYWYLLGAGVLAFFLAVFPYLAVGKLPQAAGPDGWDSRHQVLVPLGAALILYAVVMLIARALRIKQTIAVAVLVALACGFVVADLRISISYQADWFKQLSVMRQLKANDEVRQGNFFVLTDDTLALNAAGRRYQPYELTGMLFSQFGDTTRFAAEQTMVAAWEPLIPEFSQHEQYHFSQYTPPARPYSLHLTAGTTDVSRPLTVIGLMWRQYLAPASFDQMLANVLKLDVAPAQ